MQSCLSYFVWLTGDLWEGQQKCLDNRWIHINMTPKQNMITCSFTRSSRSCSKLKLTLRINQKSLIVKPLQTLKLFSNYFSDQSWHLMCCPHDCRLLWEHMKDGAASHLQRASMICLFLHLCLSVSLSVFTVLSGGRWEGDSQRSAFSSHSPLQQTGDAWNALQVLWFNL